MKRNLKKGVSGNAKLEEQSISLWGYGVGGRAIRLQEKSNLVGVHSAGGYQAGREDNARRQAGAVCES